MAEGECSAVGEQQRGRKKRVNAIICESSDKKPQGKWWTAHDVWALNYAKYMCDDCRQFRSARGRKDAESWIWFYMREINVFYKCTTKQWHLLSDYYIDCNV